MSFFGWLGRTLGITPSQPADPPSQAPSSVQTVETEPSDPTSVESTAEHTATVSTEVTIERPRSTEPTPSAAESPPPSEPPQIAPAETPSQETTTNEVDPQAFDLGNLTPLTDAQVKREARKLGPLWTSPWFGRRDLIPPASDPRTNMIDRAMIGQGLITAEELAEIHRVGAQMDKIRPDLALAHEIARQQAAKSQEERERIKQQKKAEAAERKRLHAEAVAHRKATDIIYLGRGVSGGLSERTSDSEKLQQFDLPILHKPAELAEALEIEIPKLRSLAFHHEAARFVHYVTFKVPKRSGGERELSAPLGRIAQPQRWILEEILNKVPLHDAAHGFVAGRSTVTNAAVHLGKQVVVNADLKDFFPSITFPRVRGFLQALGYSPAIATLLALLCTESPRRKVKYAGQTMHVALGPRCLPQGACTSPALSNLVSYRLDARLTGIATKLGWNYTRYADDLTFSSDEPSQTGYLLARLRHIAGEEGFEVNEKKTRVLRPSTAQTVTGIVVNEKVNVPRRHLKRLRAILHRAKTEGLEAQNRENHPHFESWLRGHIAYVSMVNPQQGHRLQTALEQVLS